MEPVPYDRLRDSICDTECWLHAFQYPGHRQHMQINKGNCIKKTYTIMEFYTLNIIYLYMYTRRKIFNTQYLHTTHTKKTRLPQPCVCTTRLFPGCHNLVVTALQPGVPLTRLSQPCGDSLATWCSSYKVVTTLWGQPCNLVFLLQGCHNLVVTTYSRPEKLGWEVRLL